MSHPGLNSGESWSLLFWLFGTSTNFVRFGHFDTSTNVIQFGYFGTSSLMIIRFFTYANF
jgi:hypothetical protein